MNNALNTVLDRAVTEKTLTPHLASRLIVWFGLIEEERTKAGQDPIFCLIHNGNSVSFPVTVEGIPFIGMISFHELETVEIVVYPHKKVCVSTDSHGDHVMNVISEILTPIMLAKTLEQARPKQKKFSVLIVQQESFTLELDEHPVIQNGLYIIGTKVIPIFNADLRFGQEGKYDLKFWKPVAFTLEADEVVAISPTSVECDGNRYTDLKFWSIGQVNL